MRTIIQLSMPVELAERLNEMARDQQVSRNGLAINALSLFAFGKPVDPYAPYERGNQDGNGDAARAVVLANPDKSLRELVRMLADMGIKRGKTWVSDVRFGVGEKLSTAV